MTDFLFCPLPRAVGIEVFDLQISDLFEISLNQHFIESMLMRIFTFIVGIMSMIFLISRTKIVVELLEIMEVTVFEIEPITNERGDVFGKCLYIE